MRAPHAARSFPWFWLIRLVVSFGFIVIWSVQHPQAPVWQLFAACFLGILACEALRMGYEREQDRRIARRQELRDRQDGQTGNR